MLEKKIKAPIIPNVSGDNWIKNFDEEFTNEQAKDSISKVDLEKLKQFQKEFKDMDFNINE